MKPRIEFNTKDIDYIQFTPVKELKWTFREYIPERRVFFGIFVKRKALKDGWSINGNTSWCDYYGEWNDWLTTKELQNKGYFQIDEFPVWGTWYERARVYVRLKRTDHTATFKTNEEANAFIEEVKKMNGDNFKVIINGR